MEEKKLEQEALILQMLRDIRDDYKTASQVVDSFQRKSLVWQNSTSHRLNSIDDNLAEHMRRTELLESFSDKNKIRIKELENTRATLITIRKWATWIIPVAAALSIFYKAFK